MQVIQHMATEAEKQARDEQLEAILGLKMMHPNIVRTFQFATKDRSVRPLPTLGQCRAVPSRHSWARLPPIPLLRITEVGIASDASRILLLKAPHCQ
jgi:hypothetical protein